MTTIELLDQIKSRIETAEKETIVKALEYNNKKNGLKRLNALISTENIEEWLKKNGYDFCHSNESFLLKLCDILGFDKADYLKPITKISDRLNAIHRMPIPHIFINTNFKRKGQPIFQLAVLEGRRRIFIDRVKVFDSCDDGLSMAKKKVTRHYQETQGVIPMWGKIDNYIYHVADKAYVINPTGEVESDKSDIFESKATISIGNRPITFLDREIDK